MASHLNSCVIACLIALAIGLGGNVAAADITNRLDAPFFLRSWQMTEGLPNNTINAIAQTRDGYLWLGTEEGLVRFDGVRCRLFGSKDGLGSLQISALLEDIEGGLWVGTSGGGVSRMFGDEIKTYMLAQGLAGNCINGFLQTTNGDLWIGTTTGLSWLHQGRFRPVPKLLATANISSLAQTSDGEIWLAVDGQGLFRLHSDHEQLDSVTWPADNPIPHEKRLYARRLMVDNKNRLWAGLEDRSILCYGNGKWHDYDPESGSPNSYANCFAQAADGTLWMGTDDKGLYYLSKDEKKFIDVKKNKKLPDLTVLTLYSGQNQDLWIGTRAGGLTRLSPKQISIFQVMDVDFECNKLSLAKTTNGNLWAGTSGQGLFYLYPNGFYPYLHSFGPQVNAHLFVDATLATSDGSIWWGAGPAFFQIKDGALISTNYDGRTVPWLAGNRVISLCENRTGGIWVGLDNGDLRLVKDNIATPVAGLSHKPVTDLIQAPDGTLWIASLGGGLACLHDGKLTKYTTQDGLNSDLIRTLYLDADGILWIGTDDGGLNCVAHGKISGFTTQDGLLDNSVLQILDDEAGNLWLGGNHGICRLDKNALQEMSKSKPGSRARLSPYIIDANEGMVSEQCVNTFHGALKTPNAGLLWFSTTRGIVAFDPHKITTSGAIPKVLIEEVLVDGQALKGKFWSALADLGLNADRPAMPVTMIPAGKHHFEFHFTGIEFRAPEKIQFRYLLEGWDSTWNEVGDVRSAIYNVPAGTYHFRVQCRRLNGQWNTVGAEMAFIVLPYFWQEPWFQIFTAIILIYLAATGIRLMERRRYQIRLKRLEREQAMERERMRIASDLHDELGANLTHISMLSEIGQATPRDQFEKLKKRMEAISSASVSTVRSLDEIVWAVNPRNDSLRGLILYLTQFARELFEDTGIQCLFQIEDDLPEWPLPPEMRHHLFLVVKEALNNALKYSKGTEISLSATTAQGQICIRVQDNGSGFCLSTIQIKSQRNGLGNMRKRIEALGGQFRIETIPGQGTTIKLTVNYPGTVTIKKIKK